MNVHLSAILVKVVKLLAAAAVHDLASKCDRYRGHDVYQLGSDLFAAAPAGAYEYNFDELVRGDLDNVYFGKSKAEVQEKVKANRLGMLGRLFAR